MLIEQAREFMRAGDWSTKQCDRCGASLERGGGMRDEPGQPRETHAWIVCHDCIYAIDAQEFRESGVMVGSSVSTVAFLRRDLEVYRPFFDTEVEITPTLQAVWEKYREHPALNDAHKKRAILVDTTSGAVFERDWGEDFTKTLAGKVDPSSVIVEIFDGMCGYVGIDVHPFDPATMNEMWVQGQVRETDSPAWYRSCYADRAFVAHVNSAVRAHVGMPFGYSLTEYGFKLPPGLFGTVYVDNGARAEATRLAWKHAEDNLRAYLSRSYDLPELQPDWIEGSSFRPRTDREVRLQRRWQEINQSRRKAGLPDVPENLWTMRPSEKDMGEFDAWVLRVRDRGGAA